jgi:hypothetical protein
VLFAGAVEELDGARAGGEARHMRGLAEKIWKVLPPIWAAVSAAFSSDLAIGCVRRYARISIVPKQAKSFIELRPCLPSRAR